MSLSEFEGLGVGDGHGATNGSNTDEDMNDLFRSFLVDGEDILTVSSLGNHSSGSQSSGAPPASLTPPSGFLLRVGSGSGGGGGGLGSGSSSGGRFGGMGAGGAGGYDGNGGIAGMRRRANTSPECDDMVPSAIPSSTQVCCGGLVDFFILSRGACRVRMVGGWIKF